MATKKKKEVKEKLKIECKICHRELVPNANTFFLAREGSQYDCEPYNRYMPICKRCSKEYILDANGNIDEDKFKYILSELDKVFVPTEFFNVKSKHTVDKVLGEYLNVVNGSGGKYKGYGYQDSIKFAFQQENIKKDNMKITQDMIDFWCTTSDDEYSPKELKRLQNRWEQLWKNDNKEKEIPTKEMLYKSICKLELAYDKTITSNPKDAKSLMDSLTGLYNSCGINPQQIKEEQDVSSGCFGKFIQIIEDIKEMPIPRYVEDLGGEDKIDAIIRYHYVGNILRAKEIPQLDQTAYEREMAKYEVKVSYDVDGED